MKIQLRMKRAYLMRVGVLVAVTALVLWLMGCRPTQHTLIVSSTEGGSVTVPGEGTFTFAAGTVVQLVAEADEGYLFTGWVGDVDRIASIYEAITTIDMYGDYSITATFAQGRLIEDWYDLDGIRGELDEYYMLTNDLDPDSPGYDELAGPVANAGRGWQPIGYCELVDEECAGEMFVGILDGQRYEIRGLCVNRTDEDCVGLFSALGEGAVVRGLGVVGANVTGQYGVGGLVGSSAGTITSSYSSGNVTGEWSVGGLVGLNDVGGAVRDSHSAADAAGWGSIGGLVGGNRGTVVSSCSTAGVEGAEGVGGLVGANLGVVNDSHSGGSVSGEVVVGGLVGVNYEGTVYGSYSVCTVTGDSMVGGLVGYNWGVVADSHSAGCVSGERVVGGLIGLNGGIYMYSSDLLGGNRGDVAGLSYPVCAPTGKLVAEGSTSLSDDWGTVKNSYATANVTGDQHVGGLVAMNTGAVSDCYSSGGVLGSSYVGGLVGSNRGLGTAISNSYAAGSVTGDEYVGGLVGSSQYALTGTNSFWDVETSGQPTSAGGTGKNTAEMMHIVTFSRASWDVVRVADVGTRNPSYIWNIVSTVTYPFLSWQSV